MIKRSKERIGKLPSLKDLAATHPPEAKGEGQPRRCQPPSPSACGVDRRRDNAERLPVRSDRMPVARSDGGPAKPSYDG
jgi:hypothetical protein